jgi:Fur family transcriptional regulator, zinc uptake regulator
MVEGCAHHDETGGLSDEQLSQALAAAEQRCSDAGERLTGPRRRVLERLLAAEAPVKAYDLMAGFGPDNAPAKPPTVYRALEFLERQGFVHRIESLNAYVACRRGEENHGAAFLICDCCGAAAEVEPPTPADLERLSAASGYLVRSLVMEARGLCAACR